MPPSTPRTHDGSLDAAGTLLVIQQLEAHSAGLDPLSRPLLLIRLQDAEELPPLGNYKPSLPERLRTVFGQSCRAHLAHFSRSAELLPLQAESNAAVEADLKVSLPEASLKPP